MPFGLGFFATAGVSGAAGSFDLLETQVLGSTTASVTFSNLNSTYGATYKHLQIRATARTNRSGEFSDPIYLSLNGSTSAEYSVHALIGNGSSVSSGAGTSTGFPSVDYAFASNAGANLFSAHVYDFLDAFTANKNRTVRILTGGAGPTSGSSIDLRSIARYNTAAITSITLDPIGSFVTGCRFSLYGIKAA